ncbi:hypothetical protein [Congregibacter litoralis]|uniref:Uncharacterized protein n=1 Tax=Congregibacter litoralis KT71 TaxID=314285 RepID=A4A4P9_9GAMM|nr:hypothetical protein [Congregibacter litoralis]EAQ98770.1 hypothetical protein KT71_09092 [Congregibacter litoralis KT71]
MQDVAAELQRLAQSDQISLQSLLEHEEFIDVLIEATQIVLRTSVTEKKAALKNAVINSALPNPPEASLQNIYLRFVDDLTSWHLRVLSLFHDPRQWFMDHGRKSPEFTMTSSLGALLEKAFPELAGRREFYDFISKDLYLKGLLSTDGLHTMMTASGTYESRSTDLGKGLIRFISISDL